MLGSATRRALAALLILVPAIAVVGGEEGAHASDDSHAVSVVTLVSEAGDDVGAGEAHLYRDDDVQLGLELGTEGQGDVLSVSVDHGLGVENFTLEFAAPRGGSIVPGDYPNAIDLHDRTDSRPGINVRGEGRGCDPVGHFTILDIGPSLSRLWLRFEQRCVESGPALFGEVRVNEPVPDSALLLAPERVDWPRHDLGAVTRAVPVVVVNTGPSPITVTGATITAGNRDFRVLDSDCRTLETDATCTLTTAFSPDTRGIHSGVLTVETSAGEQTVALRGAAAGGRTSFAARSDRGDPIGRGQSYSITPQSGGIYASGGPSGVYVAAGDWDARFRPGPGRELVSGATFRGVESAGWNAPELDVERPLHSSCNRSKGFFTIQHIAFDALDRVRQLRLVFKERCVGYQAALFGSIAWRARRPADPLPPGVRILYDRRVYPHGARAEVIASLTSPMAGERVAIYAEPYSRPRVLVDTGKTDRRGLFAATLTVRRNTVISAVVQSRPRTTGSTLIAVRARMTATMIGASRTAGSTYVYPLAEPARLRTAITPAPSEGCVRPQVEKWQHHRWRDLPRSDCIYLDQSSTAEVSFTGSSELVGVPLRMRARWTGGPSNLRSFSPWRYFRFAS